MTSNAVQRPQTSGALRVAAPWDFHHGLLETDRQSWLTSEP